MPIFYSSPQRMILLLVIWGNSISKNKQNINLAIQSNTHFNKSNGHDLYAHIMWKTLLGSSSSASATNFLTAGLCCLSHLNPNTSGLAPPKFMLIVSFDWGVSGHLALSHSVCDITIQVWPYKTCWEWSVSELYRADKFLIKSGQFWWKYSSLGHFSFGEWWPSEAVIVS